jgi:hypothetical protein
MNLYDLFEATEWKTFPDVFPDGNLKLSFHFDRDRRVERDIDIEHILDMCHRAARQWPEKLADLHDVSFVIQDWDDFGVALVKRDLGRDRYDYIVKTAHDNLRIGYDQRVIRLR